MKMMMNLIDLCYFGLKNIPLTGIVLFVNDWTPMHLGQTEKSKSNSRAKGEMVVRWYLMVFNCDTNEKN